MRNPLMIIVAAVVCLLACEKDISVNLQQQEEMLVVEGKFESNRYPQVILTHSLGYFSHIDPAILLASFVHKAVVTVSDSTRTMTLREAVVNVQGLGNIFAYIPDTSIPFAAFKGKPGNKYTLRINADNKSYESVTTIPQTGFQVDSIWWKLVRVDDSIRARLYARITDPPELGNYARYFTRRNSDPFLSSLNSTLDDQVVNGTTFEILVDAGIERNKRNINLDTASLFNKGDTVTFKFCNIDKATFSFWRAIDFAYNSNGNPFSSPIKVQGNVPGALGYWGGYQVTYRRIIVKK
ncbi:DUF4249 domain-containing protein [Chitinophaga flava]|uniref:DUF4249 domain-containing protein n=1 Tax=Chitinophaga flava TaxID=2259036 RepID=A0A365XSU7_9BACT|nr:DUF4249 domain-containing protein [Chitinophaga flava]RBL89210.1 DUF4249 domain-containing protein [Chitinophaga flava]